MSVLSAPYMHDEAAAFKHVEAMLWGDAPICAHCGVVDAAYPLVGVRTKPSAKNPEGKERHGLWKCRECRKQFTVRKGTIFEESHIAMHLWLQAIHLMVSSKKGISSHQMHRVLGITYKSAWFLTHRIRECMRDGALAGFGSGGGIVEVDETFIGKEPNVTKAKNARGYAHKMKMVTLVDRTTKRAKSIVVDDLKKSTLIPMLQENIAKEAYVMTDEAGQYDNIGAGRVFDAHGWTHHGAGQYVDYDDPEIHTNTVEGFYSIFKRGMKGVYQHCGKQHLHRYAPGRSGKYASDILQGFSGILQVDGYAGYNRVLDLRDNQPIQLAYCWAHARRKLYELTHNNMAPIAEEGLKQIAALYRIETQARGASAQERLAIRQQKSKPKIKTFKSWLDQARSQVSAKSPIGEALKYIAKYWDGLILFLTDGRIEMDSNAVERTIRPIALQRKNALFAGHDAGAQNWAMLASLIGTCKLNQIEPHSYLTSVLTAIVNGHKQKDIDQLLPWNFKG